jgi:hypothetical protein
MPEVIDLTEPEVIDLTAPTYVLPRKRYVKTYSNRLRPTAAMRLLEADPDPSQRVRPFRPKSRRHLARLANRRALLAAGFTVDAATRMTNEREPWAHALVSGQKDVENRKITQHLKNLPVQVLILASKSAPTAKDLARFKELGGVPGPYAQQAIVGAVEFVASVEHSASRWFNNDGGVGWVVGKAVRLPFPVENVPGNMTPMLYLKNHPLRARICAELGF